MSDLKICFFQITNSFTEPYSKYSTLLNKIYCDKHGYDFKVVTEYLDKNIQIRSTISFNKILVCGQEWSAAYDFIIFIDADIIINSNAPPIHSYMDYGSCIGLIDEWSQPTNERRIKIQKMNGWETSASEYYKLCGFKRLFERK